MDSLHEIPIAAPPAKVYEAWTTAEGLRAWWTSDVTTPAGAGGEYTFGFGGGVRFHFRRDEEVAGERVRWTGVAGPGMPSEWIGTHIEVRISKASDGRTRMQFEHRDWATIEGAYCACNTTWGELVYRLRNWCEGRPRGPLFSAS